MESSSRMLVFLGISFTGLTAAVVYLLLRKDEETGPDGGLRTSQRTLIKVKVPDECIGMVIGRGGCNVKAIQEKTGTRINCSDQLSTDKVRIVTIQGTPESAQLAESMIHEIIMNQPLIITHEMFVPSRACGCIIGKGGESIRNMTRTSCASIKVDSTGQNERAETRIVLKGTADQIKIAKGLIEDKVRDDAEMRRRLETSIANRSPRREPKENYNYLVAPSDDQDQQLTTFKRATFDSSRPDGFFDVFVSACQNPHQFWVQSVSPRGVELDQLVDQMTEYYSKPENLELHRLREVNVGQIVAAPFDHDDKWYRAEILSIEEDEYDPIESKVTLYYGDYGDSCVVKRKQLFDLRTDFLGLYFQAIECALAYVKPTGDEWSTEAVDLFEELSDVALWQKKVAHVVTYRESPYKRGQRAGSPVPVIELHDKNVNIGEELVNKGFAVWENSSPTEKLDGTSTSKPSASPANASYSPRPPSLPDTSANVKGSSTDKVKTPDPLKMSPSAVFGEKSSASKPKSNISSSASFLEEARKQKGSGGFRPKTLESPPKKSQKSAPVEVVYLPEQYSDNEDSDEGFTLG